MCGVLLLRTLNASGCSYTMISGKGFLSCRCVVDEPPGRATGACALGGSPAAQIDKPSTKVCSATSSGSCNPPRESNLTSPPQPAANRLLPTTRPRPPPIPNALTRLVRLALTPIILSWLLVP